MMEIRDVLRRLKPGHADVLGHAAGYFDLMLYLFDSVGCTSNRRIQIELTPVLADASWVPVVKSQGEVPQRLL